MRLATQVVSAVAFIVFSFIFCTILAARFGLFGDPGDGDPGPSPWKFGVIAIISASTFFSAWNAKTSEPDTGETT
jgi:hypothetical protein